MSGVNCKQAGKGKLSIIDCRLCSNTFVTFFLFFNDRDHIIHKCRNNKRKCPQLECFYVCDWSNDKNQNI
jgi:hypothetical protein